MTVTNNKKGEVQSICIVAVGTVTHNNTSVIYSLKSTNIISKKKKTNNNYKQFNYIKYTNLNKIIFILSDLNTL